ncbi:hypothetical protein CRM22_002307 [Opisthorchis felineus]|uniref:IQ motif and ubiquitin-like domain-containing protein n=1 Tax=Opisthorchis felineus TaxID=147828 RepID=A0A4S2M6K4_OPIFE|nr:hypothetical protein CRM22_002307 [Opisthorchis felineus]
MEEAAERFEEHSEEQLYAEDDDLCPTPGTTDRSKLAEGESSANNSDIEGGTPIQGSAYVDDGEDETSTGKLCVKAESFTDADDTQKLQESLNKQTHIEPPPASLDCSEADDDLISNNNRLGTPAEQNELQQTTGRPDVESDNFEYGHSAVVVNKNESSNLGGHAVLAEKCESRKPTASYVVDKINSLTVQVVSDTGVKMEFYGVPRKYYASEVNVLVVRYTTMRYGEFQLLYNNETVGHLTPLEELADNDGVVQFTMTLTNVGSARKIRLGSREITFQSGLVINVSCRKAFVTNEQYTLQDTLEIKQSRDGETRKEVEISWLPASHHKPFLGGYRHKLTDTRYHHAFAQTKPLPRRPTGIPIFSRQTQTYRMKHFGQSTVNNMSTQFSKPGFYVSNTKDIVRIPGPYETAEEYLERRLRDIIIIQKYTRRWLAKRRVNELRRLRDQYLEWERQHEQELKENKLAQIKFDFERRLHPKTKADFDRLFNALEQWRQEEVSTINAKPLTVAERKAALALLLDEESELIAAIGRHQLCVSQKQNLRGQISEMRKAAAPILWTSAISGRALEVDTPQTLKARELLDIFTSLRLEDLRDEERLDILLTTKKVVTQYQIKVCKDLVKLIDREAELIVRGVRAEQLRGLRERINNQFVKFAQMPEVNPEIANYIKVPTGTREKIAESLKGDVHHCLSCDRYLRNSAFPLSARANRLTPCLSCRRQDNRARKRVDMDPYQRMLVDLRKREFELIERARQKEYEDGKEAELVRLENGERPQPETLIKTDGTDEKVLNNNPFPFLVDKRDIQFLVDDVWERRSILSGWLDISDLVLTRWRLNEPWAPWNMIVVTREEAEAHEKLGNFPLELAYADAMLTTVNQRLVMGRNAFTRLRKNGIQMAYDQILKARWMQQPENSAEWLREKRQRLPPLAKHHHLLEPSEEHHRPVYQPPGYMLPAIRGEKTMEEVQSTKQ